MKYIYNSDSLSHAKTDWSWDQHKYKSKEWVNGAWKYIYNTAKNTKNKAANSVQNISNQATKTFSNVGNTVSSTAKNVVNNTRNTISNTADTLKTKTDEVKQKAQNALEKVENKTKEVSKEIKDASKNLYVSKNDKKKLEAINSMTPNQVLKGYVEKELLSDHELDTRQRLKLKDSKHEDVKDVVIVDPIRYYQHDINEGWLGGEVAVSLLEGLFDGEYNKGVDEAAALLYATGTIVPLMAGIDIYNVFYNAWAKKENEKLEKEAVKKEYERRQREEVPKLVDEMAKEKKSIVNEVVDKTHLEELWNNLKNDISNKFNKTTVKQIENAVLDDRETKAIGLTEDEKNKLTMEEINPKYDPYDNDDQWEYNCYSCAMAYDLNNRGIDVEAIGDLDGIELDGIRNCYKDPNVVTFGDLDNASEEHPWGYYYDEAVDIVNTLETMYPEGSYGHLDILWAPPGWSGGHALIFEIQNGELIIRDNQTHTVYYSEKSKNKTNHMGEEYADYTIEELLCNGSYLEIFRSDNLELNDSIYDYVKEK